MIVELVNRNQVREWSGEMSFSDHITDHMKNRMQPYMVTNGCHWRKYLLVKSLENPGIDPGTSHMLSERSTI